MSDASCRRQEFLLRSQDWYYVHQKKNTVLGYSEGKVAAVNTEDRTENSRILLLLLSSQFVGPAKQKLLTRKCWGRAGQRDELLRAAGVEMFNSSLMRGKKWPAGSWLVTTWISPDTEKLALRQEVWPGKWGKLIKYLDWKYFIKLHFYIENIFQIFIWMD